MGVHKIEYLLNKFIRLSNTTVSFILHLCNVKLSLLLLLVFLLFMFLFLIYSFLWRFVELRWTAYCDSSGYHHNNLIKKLASCLSLYFLFWFIFVLCSLQIGLMLNIHRNKDNKKNF